MKFIPSVDILFFLRVTLLCPLTNLTKRCNKCSGVFVFFVHFWKNTSLYAVFTQDMTGLFTYLRKEIMRAIQTSTNVFS